MKQDERYATAGRLIARARARRDSLPARDAAIEAYTPGGPSVDEIEAQIIAHRASSRANHAA